MFEKEKLQQILDQSITFLDDQQEKKGNFLSLSFTQSKDITAARRYHSLFFTTFILDILASLRDDTKVERIKKKAASFILSQKSKQWSFNYWDRTSKEAKQMPYPDDLDDTFCALASLFRFDPNLIDGKAMAKIVQILTNNEVKEGGPYKTWLVPEITNEKWRDVDIAVNSNIAYFLSLQDIELPHLTTYIEDHIAREAFISPYYPSVYPVIYFISRFYKGQYREKLQKYLLDKRDEDFSWGNSLHTALAVSSLLNLGVSPQVLEKSIEYLMKNRKKDAWEPSSFCIDPTREGKIFYSGSSALTTAFCMEACNKYKQALEVKPISQMTPEEDLIYGKILKKVEEVFSFYDSEFRSRALSLMKVLLNGKEGRQIPLMSYYFVQTLGDRKKNVSYELLIQLGAANVLGWIAYTIYDNFLDEEGDPVMLPIANVAHRELISIFDAIFPINDEFRVFFYTVMGRLDEANAWEVNHCRIKIIDGTFEGERFSLPRYGTFEKLACKSLGHGLGTIAILFSLGYTWDSLEVKYMVNFFEHFLIAKQLSDDAHDWEEDLKKGHINPVVAMILRKVYGQIKKKKEVVIVDVLPRLQKLFWHEAIEEVCALIVNHTDKARMILKKCDIIVDPGYLEDILVVYDNLAQKVLHERERALQFVGAYTVTDGKVY